MRCRLPRKKIYSKTATLTITDSTDLYWQPDVTINGTEYTSAQVLTVDIGSEVTVATACSSARDIGHKTYINLNGQRVAQGSNSGFGSKAKYTFTFTGDTTIAFYAADSGEESESGNALYYTYALITTT